MQASCAPFDVESSMDHVERWSRKAADQKAQLVVFPEAFLGGYPWGTTFGATMGNRTSDGRDQFLDYWKAALEIPGPHVTRLSEIARQYDLYMVIGVVEREGGTLFCTVLFFDPVSGYLGKHRKLMPTAYERVVWGTGDGSTLPVYDTAIGKLGSVICWENYMPLLRMTMYSKGIELYCAPTADSRETWLPTMRHVAIEGRCFVLSSCQFMRRGDFPDEFATIFGNDPDTLLSRGGSCIISPAGSVLAGPHFEGETLLVTDMDLEDIVRGKYDLDVTGHYARSDVFRLLVNEHHYPVKSGMGLKLSLETGNHGVPSDEFEGSVQTLPEEVKIQKEHDR